MEIDRAQGSQSALDGPDYVTWPGLLANLPINERHVNSKLGNLLRARAALLQRLAVDDKGFLLLRKRWRC